MNLLITDPRQVEAIRVITDRGHIVIDGQCPKCKGEAVVWREDEMEPMPCAHCDNTGSILNTSPWCDLVAADAVDRVLVRMGELSTDRPVHLLQATCPTCGGRGQVWYDEDTPGAGQMPAHWITCAPDWYGRKRKCGGSGRVDLGHFTVQIVPVITGSDEWDGGGAVYDNEHHWLYDDGSTTGGYQLTLDPLPQPGQFVAILERVA